MIPMVLGIYTMLYHWIQPRPLWNYLAASIAMLGGAAFLIHQHLDHRGIDVVNIQHRFFSLTCFFIAASVVLEGSASFAGRGKPSLLPGGLLLVGVHLAL